MAFDSGSLGACARGLGRAGNTYVRRRPEDTVLHQVVGAHLETFLSEVRFRNGGDGLPRFVERELREPTPNLRQGFGRRAARSLDWLPGLVAGAD